MARRSGHAARSHLVVAGTHGAARRRACRSRCTSTSPVKNYDSGGMSVEGSKPRDGHLGAILYGAAATNDDRDGERLARCSPRSRRSIPDSAIVEFNTADLRASATRSRPTPPAIARCATCGMRARASSRRWRGTAANGAHAGKPGYVTFTAWRNTPLEDAARDFLLARVGLAAGHEAVDVRHAACTPTTMAGPPRRGALAPSPGALMLARDARGCVDAALAARTCARRAARIGAFVARAAADDAGIARIEVARARRGRARGGTQSPRTRRCDRWADGGRMARARRTRPMRAGRSARIALALAIAGATDRARPRIAICRR